MARQSSTGRWRRWKDRQPRGEIVLAVPVDHAFVETLLNEGVVDEAGSRNRETLARVIRTLASNALATRGEK
jgi:hypothetical protein